MAIRSASEKEANEVKARILLDELWHSNHLTEAISVLTQSPLGENHE
jgi:hypothetical protein